MLKIAASPDELCPLAGVTPGYGVEAQETFYAT